MRPAPEQPTEPQPSHLRQMGALLWKDVLIELRTRDAIVAMMVFGILALTVFNFAFELRAESIALVAPGVLWVAVLFAGVLGLGRAFTHERERGSMEGLLLCPADRGTIFVAKFLANLTFIGAAEIVIVPVYDSFFDVAALRPGVVAVILLATIGFAAVGTVFGAMSVNTRAKEVMLPVLPAPHRDAADYRSGARHRRLDRRRRILGNLDLGKPPHRGGRSLLNRVVSRVRVRFRGLGMSGLPATQRGVR